MKHNYFFSFATAALLSLGFLNLSSWPQNIQQAGPSYTQEEAMDQSDVVECPCGTTIANEEPVQVLGTYHYPPIPLSFSICSSEQTHSFTFNYNALSIQNRFRIYDTLGNVVFDSGWLSGSGSVTLCVTGDAVLQVSARSEKKAGDQWSVSFPGKCTGCD